MKRKTIKSVRRDIDRAVVESCKHVFDVENAGGPKTFGAACLFKRHVEFLKSMAPWTVSAYSDSFTLTIK